MGHVTIAPVDETGAVELQLLKAWAATREAGIEHRLTQLLMQAVIGKNVLGSL